MTDDPHTHATQLTDAIVAVAQNEDGAAEALLTTVEQPLVVATDISKSHGERIAAIEAYLHQQLLQDTASQTRELNDQIQRQYDQIQLLVTRLGHLERQKADLSVQLAECKQGLNGQAQELTELKREIAGLKREIAAYKARTVGDTPTP